MKFVLFVEGQTEKIAVPAFLQRWLNQRLTKAVGITTICFEGWQELVKDAPDRAKFFLAAPKAKEDIIAVIALLDLYGPTFYPTKVKTTEERYDWAKEYLEGRVKHPKFKQFSAVHETEAWLLSDPKLFPSDVGKTVMKEGEKPETVNFKEPPAKLLDRLYDKTPERGYKKVKHGRQLFNRLDPAIAYEKCPYLKLMLDEMLQLAKEAGL